MRYLHRLALSDCEVVGSVRAIVVDPHVRQYLLHHFNVDSPTASAFDRAKISGITYYNLSYSRIKKIHNRLC